MNKIRSMMSLVQASCFMAVLMPMPNLASAEVSANVGVASFYLWRGQDVSEGEAQVSGGLDYAHESGAYAGVWISSEVDGAETDLYFGYAGEAGDLRYDISFWEWLYPSANDLNGPNDSLSDSDQSELVVLLGYADLGLGVYFGNDTNGDDDYEYITLDYTIDDINILYGKWLYDETDGADDSHLTLAYSYNDNLTFTLTKGFKDTENSGPYDENLLFHVAFNIPVDIE